ncbi:hypothetical protein D1007_51080 [Hordeum vulgare]|nr:hypothetical protein D1007_51080 [Hordeum vulgare]
MRPSFTFYTEIRSGDMRLGLDTFKPSTMPPAPLLHLLHRDPLRRHAPRPRHVQTVDGAAGVYDAAVWRLNRPSRMKNPPEVMTQEWARNFTPCVRVVTEEVRRRNRRRERRLGIVGMDEHATAKWRRQLPQDVLDEREFFAQRRAEQAAYREDRRMGRTCVYIHHVDKDAFLKGNIDPDPDELDMVFDLCPSYAELLEQVRKDLNWMDPSDVVEFAGRHNVGFGMHIRWKTMRVNSEQRWLAYKDTVAESLDKALELFAMKTNVPNLLDLNRVSSSIVEAIPATINEEASIEPLSCVYEANEEVNIEHEPLVEANYEHYDDGNVLHDNNLGDLDKYNLQETMDHSIPYSRGYASESDDEGPDEEVDEEGFTAKEAEAFTKVLKRDHRTPLFEDLSLADEAVVDGGEGILFGVRPPSHRDTHGKNIILPGSKFETFFELKMWLDEYSVTHYRPHKVVHSNMKLRYTVACEDRGCPWIVRARPWKGGPGWNIVSCMPHMCQGKRVDGALSSQSHRQLTSEFIAYRLSNSISSLPTMSIKSVQDLVKALFHYEVKYGKAWKAKQAAFKMLYGDWEEAYNRIPRYIPHAPAGDETGSDLTAYASDVRERNDRSYVAVCAPYVTRRCDARILVQYTEAMDRAFRALTVELYATRARLYDALTELQPSHCPRVPPLRIREPSRTELPSALEWTDVGGRTPALGPQLLDWMRYRHQSHNGTQGPVPTFYHPPATRIRSSSPTLM